MVRIQVLTQGISILLWLACAANSQPPPPRPEGGRPDSREREAFFDALREYLPHKELFDLVEHASIRQEIKLSEEDADRIDKNVGKSFEAMSAVRKKNEGQGTNPEELKRQIREAIAPFNQDSYKILEKADSQRLLGIYVQARNYRALLNDKVAKQIGLEGQALENFRQSRNESWQAIMEDMREAMKREIRNTPPGVPPPRDAFPKLFRQAEEQLDLKLSKQLTAQQQIDLENLKGAKFKLPEHPFNYPPPPSRNRGRNGGRGPGDKGPGDKGPSNKGPEADSRDCKSDDGKSSAGNRARDVLALPSRRT